MVASLSNDVLLDVLSRVGVKDLLRFRCISKSFCSSIDDPGFIKLHLSHSLKTNTNLYFIFEYIDHFFVDFDSLESVQLQAPQTINRIDSEILGCCNGLLALRSEFYETLVLWNPSTRRSKMLQLPLPEMVFSPRPVRWNMMVFGFGYDPMSDDYKLVRIIQFYSYNNNCVSSEVKVYSLRTNSWKRINRLPFILYRRSCGVHVNNALHWLVYENTGSKAILALDLYTEEYRIVELPGCLDDGFDVNVKAMGGCLCLAADHMEADILHIWTMKEYGIKESWTNSISMERPEFLPASSFVLPLTLLEKGDKILLNFGNRKVVWYDKRSKTFDTLSIEGSYWFSFQVEMLAQSLVPLNDDGAI